MGRGTDELQEYIFDILHDAYSGFDQYTVHQAAVYGFEEMISSGEFDMERAIDLAEEELLSRDNPAPIEEDFDSMLDEDFDIGSIKIGGRYKGYKSILPYDNNFVFCPNENYCLLKCVEKWMEMYNYKNEDGTPFLFSRIGINAYFDKPSKYFNRIQSELFRYFGEKKANDILDRMPDLYRLNSIKGDKKNLAINLFASADFEENKKPKFSMIVLVPLGNKIFHSMLIKACYIPVISKSLVNIEFTNETKLEIDLIRAKYKPPKKRQEIAIIYDIETASFPVEKQIAKKHVTVQVQVPHALAYQIIQFNIDQETRELKPFFHPIHEVHRTTKGLETNLYDLFFDSIHAKHGALLEELNLQEIQIFAHNGARFDNIFVKTAKNVHFLNEIRNGSQLKMISCSHPHFGKLEFVFKDTLPFCLASLKDIAKTMKCPEKKDFAIAGWSEQKYIDHFNSSDPETNWREYMKQDVDTLSNVFIALEKLYNKLGTSLTCHLGLPGVAWDLLQKTSFSIANIHRPKDPGLTQFIKEACYGGRVVAYKRYFNSEDHNGDYLIALDGNSLYPSAMAIGSFPYGQIFLVLKDNDPELEKSSSKFSCSMMLELFKNRKNGRIEGIPHFILEIVWKFPNIPQALVPYREEGTGLIYPSNGVYRGIYCDADIEEGLLDGYEVLEIIGGIYWLESTPHFKEAVSYLYNERNRLKKEGNNFEYVLKIVLNSAYGKTLEGISESYTFKENDYEPQYNEQAEELENGQSEIRIKFLNDIVRKPTYLGVYVLAYARKIMNGYIRRVGMENIYYTDTDSIYITGKSFAASGIKETSVLGGVKNDYGEDVRITKAYFLDQKRYFLQKHDVGAENKWKAAVEKYGEESKEAKALFKDFHKISCKYVGLTFRNVIQGVKTTAGGEILWSPEQKKAIEAIYLEVMENYDSFKAISNTREEIKRVLLIAEKWRRLSDSVCIFPAEIGYAIDPDKKGLYLDHPLHKKEYHSLGFDPEQPRVPLSKHLMDLDQVVALRKDVKSKNFLLNVADGMFSLTSCLVPTHESFKKLVVFPNVTLASRPDIFTSYCLFRKPGATPTFLFCYRSKAKLLKSRKNDEVDYERAKNVFIEYKDRNYRKAMYLAGYYCHFSSVSPNPDDMVFYKETIDFYNVTTTGPTINVNDRFSPDDKKYMYQIFGAPPEKWILLQAPISDTQFKRIFNATKKVVNQNVNEGMDIKSSPTKDLNLIEFDKHMRTLAIKTKEKLKNKVIEANSNQGNQASSAPSVNSRVGGKGPLVFAPRGYGDEIAIHGDHLPLERLEVGLHPLPRTKKGQSSPLNVKREKKITLNKDELIEVWITIKTEVPLGGPNIGGVEGKSSLNSGGEDQLNSGVGGEDPHLEVWFTIDITPINVTLDKRAILRSRITKKKEVSLRGVGGEDPLPFDDYFTLLCLKNNQKLTKSESLLKSKLLKSEELRIKTPEIQRYLNEKKFVIKKPTDYKSLIYRFHRRDSPLHP